jgi:hypothetical protein
MDRKAMTFSDALISIRKGGTANLPRETWHLRVGVTHTTPRGPHHTIIKEANVGGNFAVMKEIPSDWLFREDWEVIPF